MDSDERIEKSLQDWLQRGEVKLRDLLDTTDDHWRAFFKKEVGLIEEEVDKEPEKAYGHIMSLFSFIGGSSRKVPRLAKLLAEFVRDITDVMTKIKKALGAESFSITLSVPFDISVSLTFS